MNDPGLMQRLQEMKKQFDKAPAHGCLPLEEVQQKYAVLQEVWRGQVDQPEPQWFIVAAALLQIRTFEKQYPDVELQ